MGRVYLLPAGRDDCYCTSKCLLSCLSNPKKNTSEREALRTVESPFIYDAVTRPCSKMLCAPVLSPLMQQVSTAVDPSISTPLRLDGHRRGGTPAAAAAAAAAARTIGPQQHDFQRVKKTRRPRGARSSGGGGGGAASDPSPPPSQCVACLGLWDGGGLNRWYHCRRCGATVHGACRQFFEAGEACAEPPPGELEGGGGSGGGGGDATGGGGMLARPVGWRDPVNRAGVVQVMGWDGMGWDGMGWDGMG